MSKKSPGKWRHNRIFEDVDVALEHNLAPSTFWLTEEQDRAYMIARKRAKGTMEAYETHLQEIEMAKNAKKKPKAG